MCDQAKIIYFHLKSNFPYIFNILHTFNEKQGNLEKFDSCHCYIFIDNPFLNFIKYKLNKAYLGHAIGYCPNIY